MAFQQILLWMELPDWTVMPLFGPDGRLKGRWMRARLPGPIPQNERFHATNLRNAKAAAMFGLLPGHRQASSVIDRPVAFATQVFDHSLLYAGPSFFRGCFYICILGVLAAQEYRSRNPRYVCAESWRVSTIYLLEVTEKDFAEYRNSYSYEFYDWHLCLPTGIALCMGQRSPSLTQCC